MASTQALWRCRVPAKLRGHRNLDTVDLMDSVSQWRVHSRPWTSAVKQLSKIQNFDGITTRSLNYGRFSPGPLQVLYKITDGVLGLIMGDFELVLDIYYDPLRVSAPKSIGPTSIQHSGALPSPEEMLMQSC